MLTPQERLGSLLSDELLEVMNLCYPARCPDPRDSEREIWMKAGEHRVVEALQSRLSEYQEDFILNNPF